MRIVNFVLLSTVLTSSSVFATNRFVNGDFDVAPPIGSYSGEGWSVHSGGDNSPYGYGGRALYLSDVDNPHMVLYSHSGNTAGCSGVNCHRVELYYAGAYNDIPDMFFEGQRTVVYYKFKIDRIWDAADTNNCTFDGVPHKTCYAIISQFGPLDSTNAVAPLNSFVIHRHPTTGQLSINMQTKINCAKQSNKDDYSMFCDGKGDEIVGYGTKSIPIETNKWYETYSNIVWKEDGGEFSGGIREVGVGSFQFFENNDGGYWHQVPTRANSGRHVFKSGIYGMGNDVLPGSDKETVIEFDDYRAYYPYLDGYGY